MILSGDRGSRVDVLTWLARKGTRRRECDSLSIVCKCNAERAVDQRRKWLSESR